MIEYRHFKDAEVRMDTSGNRPAFVGYAAIFNSLSHDLGGFRERIKPDAFTRSLQGGAAVRCCVDHDKSRTLSTLANGELKIWTDAVGLKFRSEIPNTSYANDLCEQIKRGIVQGCSFAFTDPVDKYTNEGGVVVRELLDVPLVDVSIVYDPAYPATSVSLRSFEAWKKEQALTDERIKAFERWLWSLEKEKGM